MKISIKDSFKRLKTYFSANLDRKSLDSLSFTDYETPLAYEVTSDDEVRRKFLERSLTRMRELIFSIAEIKAEHTAISQEINDMRIIDNMSGINRQTTNDIAQNITAIEKVRTNLGGRASIIPESVYRKMESIVSLMPEGIEKIAEQEAMHKKIQIDLENLNAQREAIEYRKHEAYTLIANVRGIALISGIGAVLCIIILLILQLGFNMNAQIGFLIMAAVLAITLFTLFTKKNSAENERSTIHLTEDKLIKIQNQVKIRYVNNVNLLDYYYTKYHTNSSKALKKDWDSYTRESLARKRQEKISAELETNKSALLELLKQARLQNPLNWLHQASALSNSEEYEQIRHGLLADRESLRRQIDELEKNAEKIKAEIIEFAAIYPEYEREILKAIGDMSLG